MTVGYDRTILVIGFYIGLVLSVYLSLHIGRYRGGIEAVST